MRVLTVAVYGPKSISPLPIRYTLVVAFHNGVSFTFRSISAVDREGAGYSGP